MRKAQKQKNNLSENTGKIAKKKKTEVRNDRKRKNFDNINKDIQYIINKQNIQFLRVRRLGS